MMMTPIWTTPTSVVPLATGVKYPAVPLLPDAVSEAENVSCRRESIATSHATLRHKFILRPEAVIIGRSPSATDNEHEFSLTVDRRVLIAQQERGIH